MPRRCPAAPPAVLPLNYGRDLPQDSQTKFFFGTAVTKRAAKPLVLLRGRIARSTGCTLSGFSDRKDMDQTQSSHKPFPYKASCVSHMMMDFAPKMR